MKGLLLNLQQFPNDHRNAESSVALFDNRITGVLKQLEKSSSLICGRHCSDCRPTLSADHRCDKASNWTAPEQAFVSYRFRGISEFHQFQPTASAKDSHIPAFSDLHFA